MWNLRKAKSASRSSRRHPARENAFGGSCTLKPADATKLLPVACADLRRLGARHDGGYVVPMAAVRRAKYLLSFGISDDWSFERDFLRHNSTAIAHCFDHAVTGRWLLAYSLKNLLKFVASPSTEGARKAFKYFSYRAFFHGRAHHHRNRIWYNHDDDSVTVKDVFAPLPPRGEVFLKIDIEGSEYRILDDVLEFSNRIGALAIEFHDIDIMAERFDGLIAKIGEHFRIVHIHGNNCAGLSPFGLPNVLEITFQNRNLFEGEPAKSERSYPVPGLDASNDPLRPDLTLHFGEPASRQ